MTDDFDILLTRYFDGSASAEEAERLERQIASNPAFARAMIQVSREELGLRDACSANGAGRFVGRTDVTDVGIARTTKPAAPAMSHPALLHDSDGPDRELSLGWLRNWRSWAIAAALLLTVGTVWLIARDPVDRSVQVKQPPLPRPTNPAPVATLEATGPGVTVVRNGVNSPAEAGTGIAPSDHLHTGPSGDATFRYPHEETHVTLKPSSTLGILNDAGSKQLKLVTGVVDCDVQKQAAGQSLTVITGQAQIRVVGTHFRVIAFGSVTRVEVKQGIVRVTRAFDGATVDVSAGEHVDVGPNASTRPAAGQNWPVAQGRSMSGYWSPHVRPAGINQ